MLSDELKARTRNFVLAVINLAERAAPTMSGSIILRQLVRSGTSVGANYRAACRAKSPADFAYKIKLVEEEADESAFWLDLMIASSRCPESVAGPLLAEADELTALFSSISITLRRKRRRPQS